MNSARGNVRKGAARAVRALGLGLLLTLSLSLSLSPSLSLPIAPRAAADDVEPGFASLFDGSTLAGWTGATEGYAVENGAIVCIPNKGGNLYTEKEYANFVLRLDFQLTPGANNGIGLRAPLQGDAAYVGLESQVLDDTAPIYAKLQEYQYHGSIYGILPAKRGHLKPVGEWNSTEITLDGRKIKVVLNGVTIVEGDLDEASTPKTLDGKDHPGLKREKGHIGFLGHGSRVAFKNIRIKELP